MATAGRFQNGDIIAGRLRVDGVLGRGGFGIVLRATSLEDGQTYALKTWLDDVADARTTKRFRQEAEVWIALGSHPHIVQAHWVDILDGRLFIAMEYVEPGSNGLNGLDGYLQAASLDEKTILKWCIQLCHAMEYSASRGIRSHRDLKPGNIMIDASEAVKVTDFGLATHPFITGDVSYLPEARRMTRLFRGQTVRGIGFGTPAYMPPEQFLDAAASDQRTDMYSIGIIMYEMVTGRLPVHVPAPANHSLETRLRYWRAMEQAHRSFRVPDMDSPLGPIIAQCLQTHPTDRYPDFSALRAHLEQVLGSAYRLRMRTPVPPDEPVDTILVRAHSLRRLERWAGAANLYRDVIRMDPTLSEAWSHLGTCLAELENHRDAEQAHLKAAALEPSSAHILARWGHARLRAGREEQAAGLFQQAISLDAASAEAHLGQALIAERQGHVSQALEAVDRAVSHQADMHMAWMVRARLSARQGDWTQALTEIDRVLAALPLNRDALSMRACFLTSAGHADQAAAAFRQARRQGPLTPAERVFRSIVHMSAENHHDAVRDLDYAQGTHADVVHLVRSRLWVHMGRWGDALGELELASVGLDDPVLATQRALLHFFGGRYAEAVRWATFARSRDEQRHDAALILAAVHVHTGQLDRACELGTELVGVAETAPIASFNLGVSLLAASRYTEAWEVLHPLSGKHPEWTDLLHNMAITEFRLGHISEAARLLLRAAEPGQRRAMPTSRGHLVIRDAYLPDRADRLAFSLANGFEPRYQIPEVRPMYVMWPDWIPSSLLQPDVLHA